MYIPLIFANHDLKCINLIPINGRNWSLFISERWLGFSLSSTKHAVGLDKMIPDFGYELQVYRIEQKIQR